MSAIKVLREILLKYILWILMLYLCRYAFQSFADDRVVALGWGTLESGGPLSTALQKVELNVISNAKCQSSYADGAITAAQLCAFARGKDTCQVSDDKNVFFNWIRFAEIVLTERVYIIIILNGVIVTRPS